MEALTELISLYAGPATGGACVCQGLGEIQMDVAFLLVFSQREIWVEFSALCFQNPVSDVSVDCLCFKNSSDRMGRLQGLFEGFR